MTLWPQVVLDAPVLRGLDARAHRELAEAGRVLELVDGEAVYTQGSAADSFFIVASGEILLRAVRRGDDGESLLRSAGPGGSFGEESTVGLARRGSAVAARATSIVEIPVHVFLRAAGRSGKAEVAERQQRALQRVATQDLLRTLAFTRDLAPGNVEVLLDAIRYRRIERGHAVYRQGDPATELFLVADGMVQLQTEEDGRLHVRAYLARGDFFGDVEVVEQTMRQGGAVASGPCLLLVVPAAVFRDLAAQSPALVPSLRRVAEDHAAAQRAVVGPAAANATQHVFRDLYRLQIARSMLVIDLESCVRCGHCAWACAEVHDGVARLVRRGDKVVTRLEQPGSPDEPLPQHLMLPNSCQHCENPACMVGCPTGAIGRDPGGEVYVREALCTGCGACAKACPWDNIQMSPRAPDAPRPPSGVFAEVAVKCDLCRDYDGPACVKACPTGAVFRLNPTEDIADVRAIMARASPATVVGAAASRARDRPFLLAGAALAGTSFAVTGFVMRARGLLGPSHGIGLAAGVAAAVGMIALVGYVAIKRGRRAWVKPRGDTPRSQLVASVVRPALQAHLAIGLVTVGAALAHAPALGSGGFGAALMLALLFTSACGALLGAAYEVLPRRLSRIERAALLPEDFGRARTELFDRLYRSASGTSDLVKRLLEKVLVPYATGPLGPVLLLASGRTLREEEAALRTRIDTLLEGRGKERLAGLAELTRIVVELRALPVQRFALLALRALLPAHIVSFTIAIALLVVHVGTVIWSR